MVWTFSNQTSSIDSRRQQFIAYDVAVMTKSLLKLGIKIRDSAPCFHVISDIVLWNYPLPRPLKCRMCPRGTRVGGGHARSQNTS